jgi:hypothetical protein
MERELHYSIVAEKSEKKLEKTRKLKHLNPCQFISDQATSGKSFKCLSFPVFPVFPVLSATMERELHYSIVAPKTGKTGKTGKLKHLNPLHHAVYSLGYSFE